MKSIHHGMVHISNIPCDPFFSFKSFSKGSFFFAIYIWDQFTGVSRAFFYTFFMRYIKCVKKNLKKFFYHKKFLQIFLKLMHLNHLLTFSFIILITPFCHKKLLKIFPKLKWYSLKNLENIDYNLAIFTPTLALGQLKFSK